MREPAGRTRIRWSLLVATAACIAVVLAPFDALAAAPGRAPQPSRPIAVSVPPEPVQIAPGQTAKVHVRVLNPGTAPVTVTVTGRGLTFGDNGALNIVDRPDPKWLGRVDFPAGNLTVPAQGFEDVFVTVRMPDRIDPDLYFVGFVVSPVPTGDGSVVLVNQIGAFFTIDVPGPRLRRITADLYVPGFDLGPIHLSNLTVGDATEGELHVRNLGHTEVQFWGWNDTHTAFGSPPTQKRIDKSLLPTGRVRTFAITGKSSWPIDFVTMKVYVVYPDRTETATKQIVLTKRMLVISPWVLVAIGVLVVLFIWWLYARHRRKKGRAQRGRRPSPSPAPTGRRRATPPARTRRAPDTTGPARRVPRRVRPTRKPARVR